MGRRRRNKIPTAATASSPWRWIDLPGDVTANILQRLGSEEILRSAQKVCTTWEKVCRDPSMWRVVDLKNRCVDDLEFDLMCRCAVDRSQGQLTDLSITYFGDDDLLRYVVVRSSNLRCLTLANAREVSASALTEEVKKLPQLEELHLIKVTSLSAKGVETIGTSCPKMRSFTFSDGMFDFVPRDEYARGRFFKEYGLAIGKSMPNLRHLRLISHSMRNEGLEAILDGCPHLESLDLQTCHGLDLRGALGERCSKQVKSVRLPVDCFADFKWPIRSFNDDFGDVFNFSYGYFEYGDDYDEGGDVHSF